MENNPKNIDELLLQSILEKLQKIEDSMSYEAKPQSKEELKSIQKMVVQLDEKFDSQIHLLKYPKYDYNESINGLKTRLNQFKTELDASFKQMAITNKHKRIAIITIGLLALLLIISAFANIEYSSRLNLSKQNDMKYRFMKSIGDDDMFNSAIVVDSLFREHDFDKIKSAVEKKEELIRQKTEAEFRAKEKEAEAHKLRLEANKLNSLAN